MTKIYERTFLITFYLLFALLRFLSEYRSDIGFDFADSPSYFSPTWNNPIRMPFITYTYTFLANYSAIVLFQTILSIFSWIVLSFAVFSMIHNPIIKFLSIILILSLGITPPIVGFDLIILSESLTFSIFNYIIAMMIIYYKKKSDYQLVILLMFALFYAGTKQTSSHISIVIISLILLYAISEIKNISNIRFQMSLLVISIFISSSFIWLARQNNEISGNVDITNIIERTFDDYESQKWYLSQGFPGIAYQQYSSKPFQIPIDATRSLPQVKAWEMFEKRSPIEHYAINHPLFLILGPIVPTSYISTFTDNESALVSLARGYRIDNNYSITNLKSSNVEPFFLANLKLPLFLWWSDSKIIQKLSMVFFMSIILLFYVISFLKKFSIDQNYTSLISHFLVIFFAAVWSNWHISVTYELDRYMMPWAIELRIIFIITFVLIIDSYFKRKSSHEH